MLHRSILHLTLHPATLLVVTRPHDIPVHRTHSSVKPNRSTDEREEGRKGEEKGTKERNGGRVNEVKERRESW